ncbi:hypothetical protein R6Q59_034293 [Mikania micrantha]
MDSYGFIDDIQVEKANALARYKRFHNISKIFRLIEVFIGVVLISWTSTRLPTVFKASGEYLYVCSSYVLNQHVIFLIGNTIVVVCYVLSGHTDAGNETASPEIIENNHFRSRSEAVLNIEPVRPPVPETKQAVMKTDSEMPAEIAIKQEAEQIERFQRTRSAKLRREMPVKPRVELRRSVTERRRRVVTAGVGNSTPASFETVESLSNEEFRLAVEAFISKQQSFLKQQTLVE